MSRSLSLGAFIDIEHVINLIIHKCGTFSDVIPTDKEHK